MDFDRISGCSLCLCVRSLFLNFILSFIHSHLLFLMNALCVSIKVLCVCVFLYGASMHKTCIAIFDLFKPICRTYYYYVIVQKWHKFGYIFHCPFASSLFLNDFIIVAIIFLFVWPRTNGNYELLAIIVIVVNDGSTDNIATLACA